MPVLGTLITYTTYGTWLRGDSRGWVDEGIIKPPNALLRLADESSMNHPAFLFQEDALLGVGQRICEKLLERNNLRLLALTIQTWHVHMVVPATRIQLAHIVKETKESARFLILPCQPMWTTKCDKRFCYNWQNLKDRVEYVEAHNERMGWAKQPWPQLMPWDEYVRTMMG